MSLYLVNDSGVVEATICESTFADMLVDNSIDLDRIEGYVIENSKRLEFISIEDTIKPYEQSKKDVITAIKNNERLTIL